MTPYLFTKPEKALHIDFRAGLRATGSQPKPPTLLTLNISILPMERNSTRFHISDTKAAKQQRKQPKQSTIMFIRQFARIYMPVANMPGITLN